MMSGQSMAMSVPAMHQNGSAPACEHLHGLVPVTPQSDYCADCRAHSGRWRSLRACMSCGWVACSDDSPGRHAKAHYQETDHPLTRGLEPGTPRRWCYVHQRLV